MKKVTKTDLIKRIEKNPVNALVKYSDIRFHINFDGLDNKFYDESNKYETLFLFMNQSLEEELNKEEITDVNFQKVGDVLSNIFSGRKIGINSKTNQIINTEEINPYKVEDFIRLHYFKHEFGKEILFYGPTNSQKREMDKIYDKLLEDFNKNNYYELSQYGLKIISNNLTKKIKTIENKKVLVDTHFLMFKNYLNQA
ncbi:MAG: hypothetical protein ACMXX9_02730 [Candidatus Woesearchaeota archaeon]